jgi:hypothetical protein
MARVTSNAKHDKLTFDPSKEYKWDRDDIFEITGMQFASLYHLLSKEVNQVGGAPILLKMEAYNTMMDIFRVGVEQGVIIEINSEEETNRSMKALLDNTSDDINK